MIEHYNECLENSESGKSEPVTICQLLNKAQQALQQISKQNDLLFITVICLIVVISSLALSQAITIIQDRLSTG